MERNHPVIRQMLRQTAGNAKWRVCRNMLNPTRWMLWTPEAAPIFFDNQIGKEFETVDQCVEYVRHQALTTLKAI